MDQENTEPGPVPDTTAVDPAEARRLRALKAQEERLTVARQRRAREEAEKSGKAPRRTRLASSPKDRAPSVEPVHGVKLRRVTVEPAPEAGNARAGPAVFAALPLTGAPRARRRSPLSIVFGTAVGLGLGATLGFGLVAFYQSYDQMDPATGSRAVPAVIGPETPAPAVSVASSMPALSSEPGPSAVVGVPSETERASTPDAVLRPGFPPPTVLPAAPLELAQTPPRAMDAPRPVTAALSTPGAEPAPLRTAVPAISAPAPGRKDSLPMVRPGPVLETRGPVRTSVRATLTAPSDAGVQWPGAEPILMDRTGIAGLALPASPHPPGSGPSMAVDGRVAMRIAELERAPAEVASIPDLSAWSDAQGPRPQLQRLGPPAPTGALPRADEAPAAILDPAAPQTLLAADLSISVHLPPRRAGPATEAALTALGATGLPVGKPRTAGFTIGQSHVRYYHPEDAETAAILARAVSGPARDFTTFRPAPPRGTLEIWLSGRAVPSAPDVGLRDAPRYIYRDGQFLRVAGGN